MHGSVPQVRFPLFHRHDCLAILWAENTSVSGGTHVRRNWVRASRRLAGAAASWPKHHHRAGWRQELSGTIAQCLKLEHEVTVVRYSIPAHHTAVPSLMLICSAMNGCHCRAGNALRCSTGNNVGRVECKLLWPKGKGTQVRKSRRS